MMGRRAFLGLLGAMPLAARAAPFPVPPLTAPDGPLNVYHLGHSLVGPDMPHMLAQLAPRGHSYNSQLGSGTTLKAHWEPEEGILDFETANAAPAFRPARAAIGSGEYDAVVFTEMVELRDALRYHASAKYLRRWANLAREAAPQTRLYLYETWHRLDDPAGWASRIGGDLETLWLSKLAGSDTRRNPKRPLYLIPGGQAMAAVAQAAAEGHLAGLTGAEDLFRINPDGSRDMIHFNDLGAYVVALAHYAVLYQRSPAGLPHQLTRADGSPARAFAPETAAEVQRIVWQVVRRHPRTGIKTAEGQS
ncbi:hypothetical protein ACUXV3_17990 [Roseobacteraceae bacterium NS-SX3]